uniref:HicB family protein n=1 Tax=Candidatus Kentrum sp. FW TaxID=2126338 RepID=A0A450TI27_9GAMM|nr:MAG: hypothetical protein BECKFW1821A_GA0114235_10306 [Candidatus Kentron sp. FW]VFJ66915.1 MAG: hypothetical protein BECKFW1821B_GA0114236_11236 [Candidatus Kentron sp. FW]
MNIMTYKGYAANIEYSDDDECFIGHIAGIKDRVGFHGESVAELKEAFHEATEDYLDTCATVGKEPQKPQPGKSGTKKADEISVLETLEFFDRFVEDFPGK